MTTIEPITTSRYHATVLLNLTCHFGEALPDRDLFVSLAETTNFVVEAVPDAHMAVAEVMFEIGNRQASDLNSKRWAHNVRSMSTGDVVIVHDGMGKGVWLACDKDGWRDVTDYTLHWISGTEMAYQLADRFNAASVQYKA